MKDVLGSVKTTKDNSDRILRELRKIGMDEVLVGIPAETATRQGEPVTNADLGYIHEFGAPAANIPARPFLVPGVKRALGAIIKQLKAGGTAAASGVPGAVDRALHSAGLTATTSVKEKVQDGPFAPLSDRTIKARQRRGRTGEMKPLIDFGHMRNAVTYVIRKRGR